MRNTIVLATFLASQLAWAHGDHTPPPKVANCKAPKSCTEPEISAGANAAVKLLAAKNPQHASWINAKVKKVELRDFAKGKEWVAMFEDTSKPEGEKNLYVFITQEGHLNGANFSGK